MFGKVEKNPILTLTCMALAFLIYGYATSLPKITDFMIFCIFVISFDLLYGHMGQLSFGHMLYLGAGAYGCGMFAYHIYPDPFLSILAGVLVGATVAALLGTLVVKTSHAAFALSNLALNEVGAYLVLSPWHKWTGGEDGLSLFFKKYGFINFGQSTFRFYFCLASLLLVVYLMLLLVRSPYGSLLKAIKENEVRVRFLGYNTFLYKYITFIISGAIAAFAGALMSINLSYTNTSLISPTRNVEVIFAALMGGAGSVIGAVVGGTAFMTISNYLAIYVVRWEMFLGFALLIFVFWFREGIWGYLSKSGGALEKERSNP
ncbi:branched-chain amino acid ABC transporter permease [Desulfomonile tiedjei]|uniref:ABC-type branched-chain amino acid transport system, permease component n=1 Tax=Desulfomonile tiedjei (strain ATCC 49306 / DSM 6799 / DCB-1) TaxID=706587 RepID=I4CEG7_DESTA|nr:branched-chain amino acid ABC transporter permease [Desulfomonile tiedjei]AFM27958.1 ABC-type branched-chain amino acid transport system, permease component [Desulfomonile tiedjei DSM 6799]